MDKVFVIEFYEPCQFSEHSYIHEIVYKTYRGATAYLLKNNYTPYVDTEFNDLLLFCDKENNYDAVIHECEFEE